MSLLRRQDGNSLIEVSVILPVIVLMLLGVLDCGLLLQQDMRVADSARAGAESALLRGNNTNMTAIQNVAKTSAAGLPNYAVTATTYCSCGASATAVSCTGPSGCGTYGLPDRYVQVTATAVLPLVFGMRGMATSYSVKSVALVRTNWTGAN